MNRLGFIALAVMFAPSPVWAVDRAEVLDRFRDYRAHEDQAARMALDLRRLQQRLIETRRRLAAFRRGKTQEDLKDPKTRAQAGVLLREEQLARSAYEQKGRGKPWERYQTLKTHTVPEARAALKVSLAAFLSEHPDDHEIRLVRGEVEATAGAMDTARTDAEAVLAAEPDNARAVTLLGRCEEDVGRLELAATHYARALELEPTDARRVRAALVAFQRNRFSEALGLCEAVTKRVALPPALQVAWELSLEPSELKALAALWTTEAERRAAEAKADDLPRVELKTSRGRIVLELFENQAPNTVANFIQLVDREFFSGLGWTAHRFFAASGDPATRDGADASVHGPGYRIADELSEASRATFRGTLTMGHASGPDQGGSQFMILRRPLPPGRHLVAFGRVLEGMDVVGAMADGDRLISASVLRRRDHPYKAKTLK